MLESLKRLEEYYEYDINAVCLSVERRWESNRFCSDGCWERVKVEEKIDREERARRWKEWERGSDEVSKRCERGSGAEIWRLLNSIIIVCSDLE